jgi:uncharacterized protein (TIGR02145 family)
MWGGSYGGYCNDSGTLSAQGSYAYYWSSSEHENGWAGVFHYDWGHVYVEDWTYKGTGFQVRCVKD